MADEPFQFSIDRIRRVQQGELAESRLYERRKSHAFLRRAIPLKTRTAVLKRDGHQCVECGASARTDKSTRLEVDHIVPVARGGSSELDNLQTLCFACNQGKKDRED
jgi:5-methylcytosine-specific restriction endonuclease McrA